MGKQSLFGKAIVEPFGKGLVVLDNVHAHIHEGDAYKIRVDGNVLAGATLLLELIIPESVVFHLKNIVVYSGGDTMQIEMIENPTITDGNTSASILNLNRMQKTKASGITAYTNPTAISGGTELENFMLTSAQNNVSVEAHGSEFEWVLNNGKWLIRLTNSDGSTRAMYIDIIFYV